MSNVLTIRPFEGDADFAAMQSIMVDSDRADGTSEALSLAEIRRWCSPSDRFDPRADMLFAQVERPGGESEIAGFGRVSWYTGLEGARLYTQASFLHPAWRDDPSIWPMIVQANEHRLREVAASHLSSSPRFYQAWATANQKPWVSVLRSQGYEAVRHFRNMVRKLDDIQDRSLPEGLEIRPVQPEHFRAIWEAQREVQQELFELVQEDWTLSRFEQWLADPTHTPELWQVAWAGDQVVGMVLNRIPKTTSRESGCGRGYTEHIFVRRPWRKQGLAGALLGASLRLLKANGMDEAELGVDVENASGAFGFYERFGYRPVSTDIWYRKPMP